MEDKCGYTARRQIIERLFADEAVHELRRTGQQLTSIVEEPVVGYQVVVAYPGYKTNRSRLDYRVDVVSDNQDKAYSHVDVILNILHMCLYTDGSHANPSKLRAWLFGLAEGNHPAPLSRSGPRPTALPPLHPDLLQLASNTLGYKYRVPPKGGLGSFLLPTPLLESIIVWITLQEDINYPIPMGFQGRRMPFARYIEALHFRSEPDELAEVLQKTVSHSRVPLDNRVNYGPIPHLRGNVQAS